MVFDLPKLSMVRNYHSYFFTVSHFCTLDRGDQLGFGLDMITDLGQLDNVVKNSSADLQGLKRYDTIFSINKINVLGEHGDAIKRRLKQLDLTSVEIGAMRPVTIDSSLCKYSICQINLRAISSMECSDRYILSCLFNI